MLLFKLIPPCSSIHTPLVIIEFDFFLYTFWYKEQSSYFIEFELLNNSLNAATQIRVYVNSSVSGAVKRGRNEITRRCLNSSVTIPHEVTYRNLDKNRPAASSEAAAASFNFCGCGWPQNMLVPKGNVEGFPVQVFVMISNGAIDQVRLSTYAWTSVQNYIYSIRRYGRSYL